MNNDTIYYTLRSGVKIPKIGLGPGGIGYVPNRPPSSKTFSLLERAYNHFKRVYYTEPTAKKKFINGVASALQSGFRLIDYSACYGDMRNIRKAIDQSGVPVKEIFLTTRISNWNQFQGKKAVREEFMRCIDEIGLDSFDLLQFHWPVTDHFIDTWEVMIDLQREGLVKVLGVANCHPHHIQALESATGVLPEINQFEVHPLFTQKALIEYCKSKGIQVQAYTPLARFDDRLFRLPKLHEIAKAHHKTIIQIVLRWHIQQGLIPIVRANTPAHAQSNIDIFDFQLSDDEMKVIDGFNINSRMRYDPDNCDFTIL